MFGVIKIQIPDHFFVLYRLKCINHTLPNAVILFLYPKNPKQNVEQNRCPMKMC
jgi:hypothetical protein